MMFALKRISTALGLLVAMAAAASAQEVAPNSNQTTADAVAGSGPAAPWRAIGSRSSLATAW
jgi:hypothetical protein